MVYSNGATHIGSLAQIGFGSTAIQDANVKLNIDAAQVNGIKLNTSNTGARLISVSNGGATSPFTVFGDGRTLIGGEFNTSSNYMLTVNGKVGAREIKVSIQNPWPDYVFEKDYKLPCLDEVKNYVQKNSHLPGLPSAQELNNEELGLDVSEMIGKHTEKIENIYLYLFEMKKEIDELRKENETLKNQISKDKKAK